MVAHVKRHGRHGKPVTAKWKPIYDWLKSLNQTELVKANQISEFLEQHTVVKEELLGSHSNDHVHNYVQKCHARMLGDHRKDTVYQNAISERHHGKRLLDHRSNSPGVQQPAAVGRKGKQKRWAGLHNGTVRNVARALNKHHQSSNGNVSGRKKRTFQQTYAPATAGSHFMPSAEIYQFYRNMDKKVALQRFEMLTELHKELVDLLHSERGFDNTVTHLVANCNAYVPLGAESSGRRGRESLQAWSFNAVAAGTSALVEGMKRNVLKLLQEREQGSNSGSGAVRPRDVGRHGRRWTSYAKGWNSLGNQFEGPIAWLHQQAYRSWIPSWCAYTSSVALNQPIGGVDQGVQKVLDLRFHPGGLPQLVCSSNAAPNELLLYNLVNGRARELNGHNSQIQAVEFALGGERIVSCGANVVKVWDSLSGACLHTMGPMENGGISGHRKKISAMTVHQVQACLAATSGGEGENELLLWNIRTGELAADMNADMRQRGMSLPSMDALHFCNQNLICGSDSAGSQPAVVQVWDVDAIKNLLTFPANDSYITCLSTNPVGSTIITGSGDGSIGLFDLKGGGAIARLPLGLRCEATSVSFSSCGTFFHASSTSNYTLVWDTRMMPMEPGPIPKDSPVALSKLTSHTTRALHCLSHGDPMPTTQNAGQLVGYVDEGDSGVNDGRWFNNLPILVTASGNGSLALWDVTLGQPCVKLLSSHTRCINTVAVSLDDKVVGSGGDDQKVVLYQSARSNSSPGWRLTHPLCEGDSQSMQD